MGSKTSSPVTLGAKTKAEQVVEYFNSNPATAQLTNLEGQTVLITGCNAGIGKHTVQVLFDLGATVLMACRNVEKAAQARTEVLEANVDLSPMAGVEAAREARIHVIQMDLNSLQSVFDCCMEVKKMLNDGKIPPIRNIICNAGIMALKEYQESVDGVEKQFAVNYLGHYYMIQLLLPLLGKNVTVSETESDAVVTVPSAVDSTADSPEAKKVEDGGDTTTDEEKKSEEKEDQSSDDQCICRVLLLASSAHRFSKNLSEMIKEYLDYLLITDESVKSKTDDPWQTKYGAWTTYGFSKAVAILGARQFHKECLAQSVRFVAVHPGVIMTDLWQHASSTQKMMGSTMKKSVTQGTATSVYCSLMPFEQLDGGYYADCQLANEKVTLDVRNDQYDESLSRLCTKLITDRGFLLNLDKQVSDIEPDITNTEDAPAPSTTITSSAE